jgi:uncharacterized protein DUF4136
VNIATRVPWVLAVLMTVGSLVSAQKIQTDFNPDFDLVALKSFAFAPLSPNDPLSSHPQIAQRIRIDLKAQLEKIGLRETEAHPDFLIAYSASKQSYTDTYSTGVSVWTSGSQVGTTNYVVGTLVSDFLDPNTKRPFWRGTATKTVYAGSLQKYVPKGVQRLIEAFQKDAEKQKKKTKG